MSTKTEFSLTGHDERVKRLQRKDPGTLVSNASKVLATGKGSAGSALLAAGSHFWEGTVGPLKRGYDYFTAHDTHPEAANETVKAAERLTRTHPL